MKAKELATELENVILKINEAYKESNSEISRLDLMRQDILHKIEGTSFNASEGYKYSKALQLISKERRDVKYENEELELLRARVNCHYKQILKSTEEVKTMVTKNEAKRERGFELYKPKILSTNKNDILNQVMEILNGDE